MMSSLKVDDVFEELIEEIKRQNKELIFANRLLKVLLKMKYNLMNKLKEFDDYEYAVFLKDDISIYIKLEEQFNIICKENGVVLNEGVIESVEQNSVQKVNEQTSTEILDSDEELELRRGYQLIEGTDQVIRKIYEENGEEDCGDLSDNQQDEQSFDVKREPTTIDGHNGNDNNNQAHVVEQMNAENDNVLEEIKPTEQQFRSHDNRIDAQTETLNEQLVVQQSDQREEPTTSVDMKPNISNHQRPVRNKRFIEVIVECDDDTFIVINEHINNDNESAQVLSTQGSDHKLINDPKNSNESLDHYNTNELVNEVIVQTENECQSADPYETDNESVIILEDNVDSESESNELNGNELYSDNDLDSDDQNEINPTIGKIYNLRKSPRKQRNDYRKLTCIDDDDTGPTTSHMKKFQFEANKVEQNLSRVKNKRFKCFICSKCFGTREYLKRHLNKHTDRFKCNVLGCSFRGGWAYDLKRHVIVKHRV